MKLEEAKERMVEKGHTYVHIGKERTVPLRYFPSALGLPKLFPDGIYSRTDVGNWEFYEPNSEELKSKRFRRAI